MTTTIETAAYQLGWEDGAEMAYEALDGDQTPEAYLRALDEPGDNWDDMLVSALGHDGVCELFGQDPAANAAGWTPAMATALREYNAGAEDGARAAVAEMRA